MRAMARESFLTPANLALPLFLREGRGERTPIASMPGQARLSVDLAVELAREAFELGVSAVDLFPALSDDVKDPRGSESVNPEGLMQRAIRAQKRELPELMV
jgi:porphobilinogen synthase